MTLFASQLSSQMTGLKTRAIMTRGGASSRAARLGTENERFLGTISPKTTWRKVTRTSATANAVTLMALSVRPVAASGFRAGDGSRARRRSGSAMTR